MSTAALAAAALPRAARASENPKPKGGLPLPIALNCGTLVGYDLKLEDQINLVSKAGYDGIEPWTRHVEEFLSRGKKLSEARRRLEDAGLLPYNLIAFAKCMVDDPAARAQNLEQMKREIGWAAEIGCKNIACTMWGVEELDPLKFDDYDSPAGKSGIKVLFFAGCMGDKVYPNVTEACLKIFRARGVGVRMPSSLACCGIPALASGDADSFKKMLSHNLSKLEGEKFDYAVTACASCTETIEKFWPQYAEGRQKEQAERIAAKTLDISAFVADVLGVEPAKAPAERREKVTYHESCHLAKSLGVRIQPRKLIEANPGCELVEMREPDRCCGCGGSFTLTHYGLSKKIGGRKRDNIAASGAETVACGCPACMMQISNMLALNGDAVKVEHVAEIYARSLGD